MTYASDDMPVRFFTDGRLEDFANRAGTLPLGGTTEELLSCAQEVVRSCNPATLDFCVRWFVEAELDYHTRGAVGLGRVVARPPRFGAYYRPDMRRIGDKGRADIGNAIGNVVMSSYLAMATFLVLMSRRDPKLTATFSHGPGMELFDAWTPSMYASAGGLLKSFGAFALQSTVEAMAHFRQALLNHRFEKKGGWLSKDKTQFIIHGYVAAGMGLRLIETNLPRDGASEVPSIQSPKDCDSVTQVVDYLMRMDAQLAGNAMELGTEGVEQIKSDLCRDLGRVEDRAEFKSLLDDVTSMQSAVFRKMGELVTANGALERATAAGANGGDVARHPEQYMSRADASRMNDLAHDEALLGAKGRILAWIYLQLYDEPYTPP